MSERSQELRNIWLHKLSSWNASQLLFLDESAVNKCTGDRKYSWAPVGETPVLYQSIKRTERWSILPVYSSKGMLVWEIIQGFLHVILFKEFVRTKVVPLCNAHLGPNSILVMDNAKIHHEEPKQRSNESDLDSEQEVYLHNSIWSDSAFSRMTNSHSKSFAVQEVFCYRVFASLFARLQSNWRGICRIKGLD